tara:strand:+ start:140 stop:928 length:789 start_codon:yes stop_codon:yes gene_type:complete
MLDKSLNYLIPYKLEDLTRLGNNRDAGYVVPISTLKNCNFMVSFGMAENFSMERDFLQFNDENEIHMYDHTINNSYFYKRIYKSIKRLLYLKSSFKNIKKKFQDLKDFRNIIKNKNVTHFKEKIGDLNDTTISDVINRIGKNKKIFLKSDIEGDEFKFINKVNNNSKNIHLMAIEFHFLDKNRNKFKESIFELKKNFNLVHLHGNNYAGYCSDGLPKVLEITFTNKEYYKVSKKQYNLSFPIKNLDYPNIETSKDLEFTFSI